jgi:hypothetical protein
VVKAEPVELDPQPASATIVPKKRNDIANIDNFRITYVDGGFPKNEQKSEAEKTSKTAPTENADD